METSFKQVIGEVRNRKAQNCRGATGRSESHERNGATWGKAVFTPELLISVLSHGGGGGGGSVRFDPGDQRRPESTVCYKVTREQHHDKLAKWSSVNKCTFQEHKVVLPWVTKIEHLSLNKQNKAGGESCYHPFSQATIRWPRVYIRD